MGSFKINAPLKVTNNYDKKTRMTTIGIQGAGYNFQGIRAEGCYSDRVVKLYLLDIIAEDKLSQAVLLLPDMLESLGHASNEIL